jgi:hypothetical protein
MRTGEQSLVAVHDRFVAAHSKQIDRNRKAMFDLAARGERVIAGADDTVPSHPLGPPTVDGQGNITVNMMLQQPTRITQIIMDLTLQRFLLDRVFSSGGSVSGGAVIYDEVTTNQLYLQGDAPGSTDVKRSVEPIAPGAEYPLVEGVHEVPKIAAVEKWGGKTFITDEARDRNDLSYFQRKIRQLANSIVLKLNVRAMEKLDAAVTAHSRTASSVSWADVVTAGSSASNASQWPLATFAAAAVKAEVDELGIAYNLVILNPQEWGQLVTIYGGLSNLRAVIGELGFTIYVTNRQAAGKAKFVAAGQVGGYRVEQPLQTITYRADGEHTDRTFTKSSVRPVMYVDNPMAIQEYTGLAA